MTAAAQTFSLGKFRELFRNSRAMKYLSRMDIERVRQALEDKNRAVLEPLFDILLREKDNDEVIVRDFVMAQNRIMDDFVIETKDIEKKFFEAPRKEKVAKEEEKEKAAAEHLLGSFFKK